MNARTFTRFYKVAQMIASTPIQLQRPDADTMIELALAWGKSYGFSEDEALDQWDASRVYLDPRYSTGSPGYTGPVAIQHWDGSPEFITIYLFDKETETWTAINLGTGE